MWWRARGGARQPESGGVGLVGDDGALGHQRADDLRRGLCGEVAVREYRTLRRLGQRLGAGGDEIGQRCECPGHVVAALGEDMDLASGWRQGTRLARIGEEGDRCPGARQDQVAGARDLRGREFGQVSQPFERWDARAALVPGREGFAQQPASGGLGEPAGRFQAGAPHGGTAEEDHARLAAAHDCCG
jgi:hypothetical protein